jgi:hypothetical protein
VDGEDDIHNGFLLTVSVERIEDKNGARVIAIGGRPSFERTGGERANPPRATTTQPAKNPPEQSSMPSNAPPATTTQTMGETSRDPMVKKMNEDEKAKVETKGK